MKSKTTFESLQAVGKRIWATLSCSEVSLEKENQISHSLDSDVLQGRSGSVFCFCFLFWKVAGYACDFLFFFFSFCFYVSNAISSVHRYAEFRTFRCCFFPSN